jgi:hypothetical protein
MPALFVKHTFFAMGKLLGQAAYVRLAALECAFMQ